MAGGLPEHVAQASSPVLQVVGVRKAYGDTVALDGVDVSVGEGQIVALLGPNGAGKTTLASIIVGLTKPEAGTVTVGGVDVLRHPGDARATIGYGPQQTGLYDALSVRENLVFFGELAGLRGSALRKQIDAVVGELLLEGLSGRSCERLSGGERRRVHAAIALMGHPRLLLLDEPTVGADVTTRAALLDLVKRLSSEGVAVLYSTHYLPEVESLGAFIVLLHHGKVIARGPANSLVAQYGRAAIELKFQAVAPSLRLDDCVVTSDGQTLRIQTSTPEETLARALNLLGEDLQSLTGVDMIRPSLDTAFINLTGRQWNAHEDPVRVD